MYRKAVPVARRKQDKMPAGFGVWRFWKKDGVFFYDYDHLPEGKRAILPPKEALTTQKHTIQTRFDQDLTARTQRHLSEYRGYRDEQATNLARAAAALEICLETRDELGIKPTNKHFWADCAAALERLKIQYLPHHWRRLADKAGEIAQSGKAVTDLVSLPREGNQFARKQMDDLAEQLVIALRSRSQNYTGSHIVRTVREILEIMGKTAPSFSALEQIVYSKEVKYLTAIARFGERGREASKYRGHLTIAPAPFAGDCWMMDATRVNFLPVTVRDEKTGKTDKKSVFMAAVSDVHSLNPLAVTYTFSENRWAYRTLLMEAYRAAGHLPYELVCDRFPGHNSKEGEEMIARLRASGVVVTVTHTATAKAKQERWWRTLQSICFQHSDWYYGEGIQAKGESAHRSKEHLNAMTKLATREGWTYQDLAKEASHWVAQFAQTPMAKWSPRAHKNCERSPSQMWRESPKPHVITLKPERFAELFGYETTVTMRRNGQLTPEIEGTKMDYKCDDPITIRHREQTRVVICIDLENPETAYLFEPGENPYRRFIGEVRLDVAAERYGPNADFSNVGKAKKRLTDLENARQMGLEAKLEGLDLGEMAVLLHQTGGKALHEAATDDYVNYEMLGMESPQKPAKRQQIEAYHEEEEFVLTPDLIRMDY